MTPSRATGLRALLGGLALLLVLGLPAEVSAGRKKPLPAWAILGSRTVQLPVGVRSVASDYTFDMGDADGTLSVQYGGKRGTLTGSGTIPSSFSFFSLIGTWEIDADTGRVRVLLQDTAKKPRFTYEGLVNASGLQIDGTFTREDDFAGLAQGASGDLVLRRSPLSVGESRFTLEIDVRQDIKGRIRAQVVDPFARKRVDRLAQGTLTMFGGEELSTGKVKGKVKTNSAGETTAKLVVKAKGWRVTFKGPVDVDGFHATADLKSPFINVSGIEVTIPVEEGFTEPPPPPPPPPKNLLTQAEATIQAGRVEITRSKVPSRFFGKKADLTIQFPTSYSENPIPCNPGTALDPNANRFFVKIGSKTYGTATEPASVLLAVQQFTTIPGQVIRLHATGEVRTPGGKKKSVDAIIEATVQ